MNKLFLLIGIVVLVVVSGCETLRINVSIADNAQEFCEQKGFDDWEWGKFFSFTNHYFYCINESVEIKEIIDLDDYYLGVIVYN